MFYVGFDNSEDMLGKAQAVCEEIKLIAPDSHFEFAAEQLHVLELIDNFKKNFKKHERSAVIINQSSSLVVFLPSSYIYISIAASFVNFYQVYGVACANNYRLHIVGQLFYFINIF